MGKTPKWKFAILVWIAIYPSITAVQFFLGDMLFPLPLPIRTLVFTLILVPLMVFVLLPFLRKIMENWLNK